MNTDVVNHIAKVFTWIVTIHSANSLYQGLLLQGLVVIEIGETRHIEARNPHIYHDDDAEVAFRSFECFIKPFDTLLVAKVVIHIGSVIATTCSYHGYCGHGAKAL